MIRALPLLRIIMMANMLFAFLPGCKTSLSDNRAAPIVPKANYPVASETIELASGFGIVEAIDKLSLQSSDDSLGVGLPHGGPIYRIFLRMDNGTVQTLLQESAPVLRIGNRVRISNSIIERM